MVSHAADRVGTVCTIIYLDDIFQCFVRLMNISRSAISVRFMISYFSMFSFLMSCLERDKWPMTNLETIVKRVNNFYSKLLDIVLWLRFIFSISLTQICKIFFAWDGRGGTIATR